VLYFQKSNTQPRVNTPIQCSSWRIESTFFAQRSSAATEEEKEENRKEKEGPNI
jgi:hypothetical protein